MTRAQPLSIVFRQDLAWLLPAERATLEGHARGNAQLVLETLAKRGALFYHELQSLAELLPAYLDEALSELTALGLITADGFGGVRAIISRARLSGRRSARARAAREGSAATGRWSLFPGNVTAANGTEYLERWTAQLLKRWGVMFRDLLAKEPLAPAWSKLVPVLRRLEVRGEIRGGRFVAGVGGEQYATAEAVEILRHVRDEAPDGRTIVISAADPLNLAGIITPEPRVSSSHTGTVALCDGRLVASQVAGEMQFYRETELEAANDMSRSMKLFAAACD